MMAMAHVASRRLATTADLGLRPSLADHMVGHRHDDGAQTSATNGSRRVA
jgi:hypothetical protein